MAGHSKWANIQHRKNRQDARKAKIFTKLVREITVSARLGGADPDANPRLRAAIAAAKEASMPNDNIERAIEKGTGAGGGDSIEEVTYEGYAPGGVAVLVEGMTDNRNRTAAEIRKLFDRGGGSLGESNSVAWQFERRSFVSVPKDGLGEEALTELAIEIGAEDFDDEGEVWVLSAPASDLHALADGLRERGVEVRSAEWAMVPAAEIDVEPTVARRVLSLLDDLDDHDDVQKVWTNANLEAVALEEA